MAKMTMAQFRAKLENLPDVVSKAAIGGMRAGLLLSLRAAKTEFITDGGGPPKADRLTNRSGALRNSIGLVEPRKEGSGFIVGGLKAGGARAPYAAIHEYGGRTRAHVIRPKRGRYLSWEDRSGKRVFARKVNHPGSRIPPRPFLRPALEKGMAQTVKQITVAIDVAFKGHFR